MRDAGREDAAPQDAATTDLRPDVLDASPPDAGPAGFIGSPCETTQECGFANSICLTSGFPGGTCSQPCALYCPDRTGHPITYCVAAADLPPAAAGLGAGACFLRCDFGFYPQTGCRQGYACKQVSQANTAKMNYACLPGTTSDLTQCYLDLAADKLGFEPTIVPDAHPPPPYDHLTCSVKDGVYLFAPVRGVKVTFGAKETKRILVSCPAAKAFAATVDDLIAQSVSSIDLIRTYDCTVIAGTDKVSRHGYGDGVDLAGVTLNDGTVYTLQNEWEHDTTTPKTKGGILLYEAAYRWFNAFIWNIILTPNYNVDHDDHFHLDLTPNQHVIM